MSSKIPEFLAKKPQAVNADLAKMFTELANYEKNINKKIHKYYAYRRAAHSVLDYTKKITSGKEAMSILPGVGKHSAQMIDEYLKTGRVKLVEEEKKNPEFAEVKELVRVDGIGPVHAQKFLKMGFKSLEDLKANPDKLNHHEKIGLKYVYDFEARIPRPEMDQIKDFITEKIKLVDDKFTVTLCGSYRRGASSSYHIDVLLTHPWYVSSSLRVKQEDVEVKQEPDTKQMAKIKLEEATTKSDLDPSSLTDSVSKKHAGILLESVVAKLVEIGFLTDTFSFGGTKYTGVCCLIPKKENLHRRINFRLIPQDEYVFGLFYMTGSFDFGKEMRKIAAKKGFTLNEYCLRRTHKNGRLGSPIKVTCEKDIFDILGIEYKTPEERNL